jgi:hypothetical protein
MDEGGKSNMVSGKPSWALALIGVVVLGVGIVGILGVIPGLSLSAQGPGVSFTVTQANYNVTVTDTSSITTGTWTYANISWGDGTSGPVTTGGTYHHLYSVKGNFTITETYTLAICAGLTHKGEGAACPAMGTGGSLPTNRTVTADTASVTISVPKGGTVTATQASVVAGWTYTVSGLAVRVTDASVATSANVTSIQFYSYTANGSGPGNLVATVAPGGSETVTYTTPGSYVITEKVTWLALNAAGKTTGTAQTSMSTLTVQVAVGTGGTGGNAPPPASVYSFTGVTALLVGAGTAALVVGIIPLDWRWRILSIVVVGVVAFVVGDLAGAGVGLSIVGGSNGG